VGGSIKEKAGILSSLSGEEKGMGASGLGRSVIGSEVDD